LCKGAHFFGYFLWASKKVTKKTRSSVYEGY
jgi:hypothetical protein